MDLRQLRHFVTLAQTLNYRQAAEHLHEAQIGEILACDPNVDPAKAPFPLTDLKTALQKADILLLLVDHAEFLDLDHELIKDKVVIDTKGVWR